MARKRKPKVEEIQQIEEVEIVEQKAPIKHISNQVVKLIKNPLKLALSITLHDFEPYPLSKVQLEDEIFMEHIEKLISLKKIKRV